MDGIHDVGGMHGFGPVGATPHEPPFSADWERRVFGLAAALRARGDFNMSEFRHAIERMDPGSYLTTSYYEHWLHAVATLSAEKGVLGGAPSPSPGHAAAWPAAEGPAFAVGERVRVRTLHAAGHTRCPRYVRGRAGVVTRRDHESPLPDAEAAAVPAPAQRTYSVRFDAAELWGEEAEPGATVNVDLWHGYLERA